MVVDAMLVSPSYRTVLVLWFATRKYEDPSDRDNVLSRCIGIASNTLVF